MQDYLFDVFRPVTATDIDALPDPSFRNLAREKFRDGLLDVMLAKLVNGGIVGDTDDALRYLSSHNATLPQGTDEGLSRVTLSDLGIRKSHHNRLHTLLSPPILFKTNPGNIYRQFGILSHDVLARLCGAGETNSQEENAQMQLFATKRQSTFFQYAFGFIRDSAFGADENSRSLRSVWQEACAAIESGNDFFDSYHRSIAYVKPLMDAMRSTFHIPLPGFSNETLVHEKWLWLITLCTWANAFFALQEGKLPVPDVHEIQVLSRAVGLSGGRIDGVQILPADYRAGLHIGRGDFGSIGELCHLLRQTQKGGSTIRVIEWKFSVGDYVLPGDIICPEDIAVSPFRSHREQVERYLTFGPLDEYYTRNAGLQGYAWEEETLIHEGYIVYLFPTAPPIIHRVALAPCERREVFLRDVVSHWGQGKVQALFKKFDRNSLLLFIGNGSGIPQNDAAAASKANAPDILFPENKRKESSPIVELIDRHRKFLGEHNIVEERSGSPVLHLDRLLGAIKSGLVKTSESFRMPEGGLVACPVHKEKTPSCSVRPREGFFHCFGCHIAGRLTSESIPQDFRGTLNPEKWITRKELFGDFSVPEEHHQLLCETQRLLQEEFFGSDGERYVEEARKIDPGFAYEKGAGFGTARVITTLLDRGVSLAELTKVGLVRFSSHVSSAGGIYKVLRRRGMYLGDVRKEIGKAKDGKSLFGLPYFPLERRVTFPLTLRGKYTNIYGRSAYPDAKVPHTKLSTQDSQVRHGAFNEEVLSSASREVGIVEGIFDALCVEKMFSLPALAVIGTTNKLIVELVVQSGKDVAVALDNDDAGRKSAVQMIKSLRALTRFKGKVRDFTQHFIEQQYGEELKLHHAGLLDWRDTLGWDDWNTLFINEHEQYV